MGVLAFWLIGTAIFAAVAWVARMVWPLLALGLIVASDIWLFKVTVNFGASMLGLEAVYVFHRDIVADVTRQARLEHRFVMRDDELHLAQARQQQPQPCHVETLAGVLGRDHAR